MSNTKTIELDDYQRANLIALLEVCGYGNAGRIYGLDTGDWVGEIYWKLVGLDGKDRPAHQPNKTAAEMIAAVRNDERNHVKG